MPRAHQDWKNKPSRTTASNNMITPTTIADMTSAFHQTQPTPLIPAPTTVLDVLGFNTAGLAITQGTTTMKKTAFIFLIIAAIVLGYLIYKKKI